MPLSNVLDWKRARRTISTVFSRHNERPDGRDSEQGGVARARGSRGKDDDGPSTKRLSVMRNLEVWTAAIVRRTRAQADDDTGESRSNSAVKRQSSHLVVTGPNLDAIPACASLHVVVPDGVNPIGSPQAVDGVAIPTPLPPPAVNPALSVDSSRSPVSSVLFCQELLENVFGHCTKASNSTNILVCKDWFSVGLPFLWRRLESHQDFMRLVRLLPAPLSEDNIVTTAVEGNESLFQFQLRIDQSKCERFLQCSGLVTHILFEDSARLGQPVSIISIEQSCGSRVFPNLRTLMCRASTEPQQCLFLVQDTITHLILDLKDNIDSDISLVKAIPQMPRLTQLDLDFNKAPLTPGEDKLKEVIPHLLCLRRICLPANRLTWSLLECLAALPVLQSITFSSSISEIKSIDKTLYTLPQDHRLKSFPALQILTLAADADTVVRYLTNHVFPSQLRAFHLQLTKHEWESSIQSLLRTIGSTFRDLENFSVEEFDYECGTARRDSEHPYISTFDTIQPILSFPALKVLRLKLRFSTTWSAKDIETLATALPEIESLDLNFHPHWVDRRWPPFQPLNDILEPLAHKCHKLRHLALYSSGRIHIDEKVTARFSQLKSLNVGYSWVQDKAHTALYLAKILPPTCMVGLAVDSNMALQYLDVIRMIPRFRQILDLSKAELEEEGKAVEEGKIVVNGRVYEDIADEVDDGEDAEVDEAPDAEVNEGEDEEELLDYSDD